MSVRKQLIEKPTRSVWLAQGEVQRWMSFSCLGLIEMFRWKGFQNSFILTPKKSEIRTFYNIFLKRKFCARVQSLNTTEKNEKKFSSIYIFILFLWTQQQHQVLSRPLWQSMHFLAIQSSEVHNTFITQAFSHNGAQTSASVYEPVHLTNWVWSTIDLAAFVSKTRLPDEGKIVLEASYPLVNLPVCIFSSLSWNLLYLLFDISCIISHLGNPIKWACFYLWGCLPPLFTIVSSRSSVLDILIKRSRSSFLTSIHSISNFILFYFAAILLIIIVIVIWINA